MDRLPFRFEIECANMCDLTNRILACGFAIAPGYNKTMAIHSLVDAGRFVHLCREFKPEEE